MGGDMVSSDATVSANQLYYALLPGVTSPPAQKLPLFLNGFAFCTLNKKLRETILLYSKVF
jgi:hypothetical protein